MLAALLPAWALSALGALGGVGLKMLMELLGENFVKKAAVISMRRFASTTDNSYDDQVAEACAEAWGVDKSVLK